MSKPAILQGRFDRPNIRSVLLTVLGMAVMVWLGSWQVDRLAWKQDLLKKIEDRASGQAIPLPEHIDDPAELDFQRVLVSGLFFHEMAMTVIPRTYKGQVGAHLVTPVQLPSGAIVLVNRGFVPNGWQAQKGDNPQGLVTFTGIARIPEKKSFFTTDNDPANHGWYWINPPEMAAALGLDNVLPVVVYASELANPGSYPIGGQARLNLPNDHLQYAIFWYGMALVMGIVFILYHYRRGTHTPP